MALNRIVNPPSELGNSADWGILLSRQGYDLIGSSNGMNKLILTNWNTGSDKPQIADGSIIEVGGSLYRSDGITDISTYSGDGDLSIRFTPSGDGSTLSAEYVLDSSVPVWDAVKQGWYTGTQKFASYRVTKSGSVYSAKGAYQDILRQIFNVVDGSIQIPGSVKCLSIDTGQGLTDVYLQNQNIRSFDDVTFNNTNLSSLTLYNTSDGIRPVSKHSTQTLSAGQVYTVPVGVYMIFHNENVQVDKRGNGSTWFPLGNYHGVVFSDGSDLRLTNPYSHSVVVNFWRL